MLDRPSSVEPEDGDLPEHHTARRTAVRASGPPPAPRRPTGAADSTWSAEVQALRAVAVLLVVLYHLWPERLTGGYVGVDVFFAISGFLITGHILRDLDLGRFHLGRFYARRARRLLPASLLVLLATMLAVLAFLPATEWVPTAQQVLASAGYVENWVLAAQDVDYLQPTITPSAVQHFWSLSVEEQFYLVWPLLLLVTAIATRGRSAALRRRAVAAVMAVLLLASLGHAVDVTAREVDGAYFFSTARMWQFAAGGSLALALHELAARTRRRPAGRVLSASRGLLSWAGFGAIAATGYLYSEATPFPGWAAVVPVAGALAVIAAGHVDSPWSPAYLVRFGPTQFIGDVSYSLYLWHWPLIVLAPAVLGRLTRTREEVALLGLSMVLAWLTKVLVEDRLRGSRPDSPRGSRHARRPQVPASAPRSDRTATARRRTLVPAAVMAGAMVLVTAAAGGTWWHVERTVSTADALAARALAEGTPCFGADALLEPRRCQDPPFGDVVTPVPAAAVETLREAPEWDRCLTEIPETTVDRCTFGNPAAQVHVVLFGDSHAYHWLPALRAVADKRGWRLTTFLRASCGPSTAWMTGSDAAAERRCHDWATRATATIADDESVDVVITSAFNNKRWRAGGERNGWTAGVAGYRRTWERLVRGGDRTVVALADTPGIGRALVGCTLGDDPRSCRRDRRATGAGGKAAPARDPLKAAVAAADHPAIHLVDLTDGFCGVRWCPAVVGNVLVYADSNHISPVYSRSLAPELDRRLASVLDHPRRAEGG